MFGFFRDYSRLYVTNHINLVNEIEFRIVRSSSNALVNGMPVVTFAIDIDNNVSTLFGSNTKKIGYYVNRFGFPKKNLPEEEKARQEFVVKKIRRI